MHYHTYEMAHALLAPWRAQAQLIGQVMDNPLLPIAHTKLGRTISAACEVFEGITRRYGKPAWGITETKIAGLPVPIREEVVMRTSFCELRHFDRDENVCGKRYDPKVLVVAPMSGHYATLLRGTVQAMLPEHNLYVTDWVDARNVPVFAGKFDLDDFVDHVMQMVRFIGHNTHVVAVCQPSVPVLAATALMAAMKDPCRPASITLMGGPIDTRCNPTAVNQHAMSKDIGWFERNVIAPVPWPNMGCMRLVYPGFIQLSGFMTMNLDRHVQAHKGLFDSLVKGDCDPALQHRKFYDEYLAVMDLPAEFFLQTVKTVFQDHDLPDGRMKWRGETVDCRAIEDTVLMTVEGERDDICGLGQTEAAHALCVNLPSEKHVHYVQQGVGHYGVFNGTRWRTEIQPRIREMIRNVNFQRRRLAMN
ncbi:MAG TPA: polyhydroxyalkanoate depolymerase [Geminicoccus sp.]|uniref:polyhydroxyalkanoate depolymerase n=1 Tax=Geminicoccus sp. TaxID=2024832 RepID=UPI002E372429|nr:polyhydroxyalkanoate depolymerase [Geminicoccus sp.]HEX2525306.1 polyhydroxyalkanoate depolymerase [Geminicoccus sp.]